MAEIDFFFVVSANQLNGIFEHCHHSEAEKVHLDDAHVRAVLFVPLHDNAAGHGGRFKRHHGIELSLADHHSSGMLAQMAWQVLHFLAKFEKYANAMMRQVEA